MSTIIICLELFITGVELCTGEWSGGDLPGFEKVSEIPEGRKEARLEMQERLKYWENDEDQRSEQPKKSK